MRKIEVIFILFYFNKSLCFYVYYIYNIAINENSFIDINTIKYNNEIESIGKSLYSKNVGMIVAIELLFLELFMILLQPLVITTIQMTTRMIIELVSIFILFNFGKSWNYYYYIYNVTIIEDSFIVRNIIDYNYVNELIVALVATKIEKGGYGDGSKCSNNEGVKLKLQITNSNNNSINVINKRITTPTIKFNSKNETTVITDFKAHMYYMRLLVKFSDIDCDKGTAGKQQCSQ